MAGESRGSYQNGICARFASKIIVRSLFINRKRATVSTEIGIEVATVKNHVHHVLEKLAVA